MTAELARTLAFYILVITPQSAAGPLPPAEYLRLEGGWDSCMTVATSFERRAPVRADCLSGIAWHNRGRPK